MSAQTASGEEVARWRAQADRVTIIRDNWGIPHIYGKSDADAVFGLLYAQCEDDFQRVEMNYIEKLGRKSEVFGEKELNNDLYVRLVIDSLQAMQDYSKSPQWLVKLMNAFADGVNYYLYTPGGKAGAAFKVSAPVPATMDRWKHRRYQHRRHYRKRCRQFVFRNNRFTGLNKERGSRKRLTGSNGFALSPSRTISGNAIFTSTRM